MSFIKDFNELHISTKGTILNVLSTFPFFFTIVYLFKHTMINNIPENPITDLDFYFLVFLCLSLSILWFLMNFILTAIVISIVEKIDPENKTNKNSTEEEEDEKERAREMFALTYIYSIGYVSIGIFLNYTWLQWSFKWFILGCFGFIIFRIIWTVFWILLIARLSKNN